MPGSWVRVPPLLFRKPPDLGGFELFGARITGPEATG